MGSIKLQPFFQGDYGCSLPLSWISTENQYVKKKDATSTMAKRFAPPPFEQLNESQYCMRSNCCTSPAI